MADSGRGRARLNTNDIVTAAIALIDAHGAADLTMRRLGSTLGAEAMALYRYFPSRNDLINAIVERLVADATAHPEAQLRPADDWRDYLDRLAHGVRRMALAHPRAFPLVASHPTEAPWIRPPLRSLDWVASFLSGLQDHHFPPPAAVSVYKQFCTFLLGHLLLEVAALGLEFPRDASAPSAPPDADAREASRLRHTLARQADRITTDDAPGVEQIADDRRHRPRSVAEEPAVAAVLGDASTPDGAGTPGAAGTDGEAGTDGHAGTDAEPGTDEDSGPLREVAADLPVTAAMVSTAGVELSSFPHVQAAAGLLAQDTFSVDFDRHLSWLLEQFADLRRA